MHVQIGRAASGNRHRQMNSVACRRDSGLSQEHVADCELGFARQSPAVT